VDGEPSQARFTLAPHESLEVSRFERLRPRTALGVVVGPGTGRIRRLRIVVAEEEPSQTLGAWLDVPVATDGSFSMPVLEGFDDVWVLAGPDQAADVSIVPRRHRLRPGTALQIESVGTVRATGRVVDSQGKPRVGWLVSTIVHSAEQADREPGHGHWLEHLNTRLAQTDADGRFTTQPAIPGLWTFKLRPLDRRQATKDPGTDILVGADTGEIELIR
jgi:hypothetical protein